MNRLFQSIGIPVLALFIGALTLIILNALFTLTIAESFLIFAAVFCILLTVKNHIFQTAFFERVKSELSGIESYERDIKQRMDKVAALAKDDKAIKELENRINDCERRLTHQGTLLAVANRDMDDLPEAKWPDPDQKVVSIATAAQNRNMEKQGKLRIPTDIASYLEDGKLCMHLQPALYLLDRTVKDYEALARLDLGQGRIATAEQFFPKAEKAGCLADIDQQMLFKIITLIRELDRNDIHPNIFWNLSGFSLKNNPAFEGIENTLRANSAICSQITCEISQNDYVDFKPRSLRRLSTLREMGLNLSIDNCTDVALVKRVLKTGLFADVKIPATTLVGYGEKNIDLVGQEIAELAIDNKARVIATQVEKEFQVMELIDQDILYGQGNLFSEPKPAKSQPAPSKLASVN